MPVFFIVGGFANSAWWDSARRSGIGHADWLRTRFARLLRPTVAFVAVWTVGGTVVALAGVDASRSPRWRDRVAASRLGR